ncbi:MAG TPA: hypothetical protein VKH44_12725 [Pirellulaceae bacterium]|nr:hypothetical protein [Pirellulaceae bacterium]
MAVETKVCSDCGAQVGQHDSTCWLCGAARAQQAGQPIAAQKTAAMTVGRIAAIVGMVALFVGVLAVASVVALFSLCMVAISGAN